MTFPFPTFVPVASAAAPVVVTYLTNSTDTANATTYTFTALSFGTATSDRVLIATIGARQNSAGSISSVTIGGISATAIATANNAGGGSDLCAIYAAAVPTGTSGNVVVTFSGTYLRCAVGLYGMTGTGGSVTAHATSTVTPTGSSPSTTINCPANGAIVAVNFGNSSATATTTWTGVTENYDLQPESAANGTSGAHDEFATQQTGLTVTATVASVTAQQAMSVASWGPA